ncbi:MAG TPA: arsenite methyltransferase [Candidatus Gastranaerophilaceae bacterium]|nr:arsenite methyltransferase [Candidatus Gastranaerophilaceae bacterium]HPT41073.1 arsenite methyltransferase [Candidatus Gastranaerophilaceae bacterium]
MEFDIREKVKEFYGDIASDVSKGNTSSCACCDEISKTSVIYDGAELDDLPIEAINASLGCSNPLVLAELKEGETVLDLGSGGGIDVLMSSKYVGKSGKIYGLDMTDQMLELANKNKEKMGADNVEFIKGYIENIPLADNSVDAVISNCVINLSSDKKKALSEAYRVIKEGGRLAVADVVSLREVTPELKKQAELWAGCIAGTILINEYKQILSDVGFKNIEIEPMHIYSKAIIEELVKDKNELAKINLEEIDGAFAGAHIKAWK